MNIPIAVLKLWKICDEEDFLSRFALSNVRVESSGEETLFIATDGKKLAVVKVPGVDPSLDDKLIPREIFRDGMDYFDAFTTEAKPIISLTADSGWAVLRVGPGSNSIFRGKFVDKRFPKWRSVFAALPESRPMLLDAKKLTDLCEVVSSADGCPNGDPRKVVIRFGKPIDPIEISTHDGPVSAVAVLMPVSGEYEPMRIEAEA